MRNGESVPPHLRDNHGIALGIDKIVSHVEPAIIPQEIRRMHSQVSLLS